MKQLLRILVASLLLRGAACDAVTLDLAGYQDAQGAIAVHYQGDFSDPYFAMKALLSARQAGLDIAVPARDWVAWMLPRQKPDGLFERFCRQGEAWVACKAADADDALLAMWIELLHVLAPDAGLPGAWRDSVRLARGQLDRLRDRKSGVYIISLDNPVALLMDNVEVYAALRTVGRELRRMKQMAAAESSIRQALALRLAIERVFHPHASGPYLASTQRTAEWRFYPEILAQIYPWLHRMPVAIDVRSGFKAWMEKNGADWLSMIRDDYPWGVVALVAIDAGDCDSVLRWAERAAPLRHGARWNVLEEAAFQSVTAGEPDCSRRGAK